MMKTGWVDFHSHVLPGVDDGARTLAESRRVLAALQAQGVSTVFCTSHMNSHFVSHVTGAALRDAYNELRLSSPAVSVLPGCEFYWNPRVHDRQRFHPFPMGCSRYVLMELPYEADADLVRRAAEDCAWNGYLPVIAHPERYAAFRYQAAETLDWAAKNNVPLQLNAYSLIPSEADSENGIAAWRIVESGLAAFLGSDTHGDWRPPVYREGALALLDWGKARRREDYAENILWRNAMSSVIENR